MLSSSTPLPFACASPLASAASWENWRAMVRVTLKKRSQSGRGFAVVWLNPRGLLERWSVLVIPVEGWLVGAVQAAGWSSSVPSGIRSDTSGRPTSPNWLRRRSGRYTR